MISQRRFSALIKHADAVILGSFVPEGSKVLRWLLEIAGGAVAFYDIDTPVTVAKLYSGDEDYLAAELLPHLDLYLSFTGGPLLERIRRDFRVRRTEPLYCAVDPDVHRPVPVETRWDLGYLGTYSDDRQPKLEHLLNEPARSLRDRRFVVAGPQYPSEHRMAGQCREDRASCRPSDMRCSTMPSVSRSTSREATWWRPDGRRACVCSKRRPAAFRSSATHGRG